MTNISHATAFIIMEKDKYCFEIIFIINFTHPGTSIVKTSWRYYHLKKKKKKSWRYYDGKSEQCKITTSVQYEKILLP